MVRSQAPSDLTIAGLAKAGAVGVETIRFYQRRGLLPVPPRGSGGGAIRRYGDEELRRLRFIRTAQGAGFTLDEIAELLALDQTDDRPRARALAKQRIAALDEKIAQMNEARAALSRLAKACGEGSSGPCPILQAFEHKA